MNIETSIALPDNLVAELHHRAPQPEERSALVAEALRCYFTARDAEEKDLQILDLHAEELNREAEDVLDYQVVPSELQRFSLV